jgi:hypothetical protein
MEHDSKRNRGRREEEKRKGKGEQKISRRKFKTKLRKPFLQGMVSFVTKERTLKDGFFVVLCLFIISLNRDALGMMERKIGS